MSGFTNTVDLFGDNETLARIIGRTIIEYKDDKITNLKNNVFADCEELSHIDLPAVTNIEPSTFSYCTSLRTVVFRHNKVMPMYGGVRFHAQTPISSGTGYIYVPRDLINSYKTAGGWKTYNYKYRAIEDWTDDGTVDGDFSLTRRLLDGTIKEFVDVGFTDNTSLDYFALHSCSSLVTVDLHNLTNINAQGVFTGCTSLTTLILRNESGVVSGAGSDGWSNLPITNGAGYVYVPRALLDSYKTAANWSTVYANHPDVFRAIEDYPEITGGA